VLYSRICFHLWTSRVPGYSFDTNRSNSNPENSQISSISGNNDNNLSNISSVNLLLKRRKKVIKLLVVIVLAFAIFSLPFHARKLIQHYLKSYNVASKYASMFTIFTTLFLYMNSGINPLLYAIFSKKLRNMMFDLISRIIGICRRSKVHTNNNKRRNAQNCKHNDNMMSRISLKSDVI
jgi:hypothetical protein